MAEHHPLGDIEYLRETFLKSYRPGFPILKELIQNAEDAQSTHLDYGWTQGIKKAYHPLLRSPALFFVDNGNFTDSNAKAIRYIMGGSSKPNQEGSIGKFGLGLKSVFHFCEAFFYLAPPLENAKYSRCSIFNPWAGAENKDDYHQGWNDFTVEDQQQIQNHLQQVLVQPHYSSNKWFILWIPLRQETHKTYGNREDEEGIPLGYISREFYPQIPTFLSNKDTKIKIGSILILLHKLEQINYWEENHRQWTINLLNAKRQVFSRLTKGEKNQITGIVRIDQLQIEYIGTELISDEQNFHEIISNDNFPRKFKNIKPHYGVIFSKYKNNNKFSLLSITTNVFLPIGEEQTFQLDTEHNYSLVLHGYFFVDSGRNGILGLNHNTYVFRLDDPQDTPDDRLKKQWNQHLYKLVLAGILSNFKLFVDTFKISNQEIFEICTGLQNTSLFKKNLKDICQEQQWIYKVTPNEEKWVLISSEQRVLSIPKLPQKKHKEIWNVFSGLIKIAENLCLTIEGYPNLTFNKQINQWTIEEIKLIVDTLANSEEQIKLFFQDNIFFDYLLKFLDLTPNGYSDLVQKKLCQLLKKGLSYLTWEEISHSQNLIKRLLKKINSNYYFCISCKLPSFKSEIIKINKQSEILIINEDFIDKLATKQTLNNEDGKKILQWISQQYLNQNNYQIIVNLTQQVFKAITKYNADISFIVGKNIQNNPDQFIFYSKNELDKLQKSNFLFKMSNDLNLAKDLQKSLAEQTIILVEETIADILYDKNIIPICNHNSCFELLQKKPKLNSSENRKNLLVRLLQNV